MPNVYLNPLIASTLKTIKRNRKVYKAAGEKEIFSFWKLESEFNEFEPCLKSAKYRFLLSAGLNFGTFNTILSETNYI